MLCALCSLRAIGHILVLCLYGLSILSCVVLSSRRLVLLNCLNAL